MSIVYDKDREAELASRVQTLGASYAEVGQKIEDLGTEGLSDEQVATRNELIVEQTKLANDHRVATDDLTALNLFKPSNLKPEVEKDPEMEAFGAMLRSQEPKSEKMEISLEAIVRHQQSQMVARSDQSGNAAGNAAGATQIHTQPTVVDSLKAYGAALNAVPIIETPDGNPMQWPVTDNSSSEGEMLADEGTQITSADPAAVTTKSLAVKRFSSKKVPISNTLIQDSVFDIESYATMLCMRRIGRTIGGKMITATASADGIDGFKSLATQVTSGTGAAKTTWDVIGNAVQMIHKVDRAYLSGEGGMGSNLSAGSGLNNSGGFVGWLVSRDAMRIIRTAKDGDGRLLWQPNTRVGEPSMLQGYPIIEVDEMDAFAAAAADNVAGNMPVMFGNFTYFQARFAKRLTVERFYDSGTAGGDYTEFLGLTRFGMRSIIAESGSKNPALAAWTLATG